MKGRKIVKKKTASTKSKSISKQNKNILDDFDEEIDMTKYNNMDFNRIFSEEDMKDIISNKRNYNLGEKYLSEAFRFMRNNKIHDFRKVVSSYRFIVNTKYNKTYLLHEACRLGHSEIVTFLLFLGAKANVFDSDGMMAQHYASKLKDTTIIDIFSMFGIDLNSKDTNGNTPLHYAAQQKNREMIQVLISYRVNPKIKNNLNLYPIDNCIIDKDLTQLINDYIQTY